MSRERANPGPYDALQMTVEMRRELPRVLASRYVDAISDLWAMFAGQIPDTPEGRAGAFAEVCAVLDEAAKLTPVVKLAAWKDRRGAV